MKFASPRWQARGLQVQRLTPVIFALGSLLWPVDLIKFFLHRQWPWNDYFAFYSYSLFVRKYPAALIYNIQYLREMQPGLHGATLPYLYDPALLLLIWPLGWAPFLSGQIAWACLGVLAFAWSIASASGNQAARFAAIIAPSTLWTLLCGQSALFGAALLFGGFRMLPSRPILAGLMFGILTYKPQLAVLIPLALAASRQWCCLLASCFFAALLMMTSLAAFGSIAWIVWLHDLPALADSAKHVLSVLCPMMTTVTSNLLTFGVPIVVAQIVQVVAAIGACVAVWITLRAGVTMRGAAAVAVGTFLTTPFAFAYDLPLVTGAIIIVAMERYCQAATVSFWEVVVLCAALLLPGCSAMFCISSVIMIALLCLIVRRATIAVKAPTGLDVLHPAVVA